MQFTETSLADLPAHELLEAAIQRFGRRFCVLTSFQREGMVILDLAARIDPQIRVVTLDTGRLPPATYDMIELVRQRYGVSVEMVSPEAAEVERMVTRFGPNLFYESVPLRSLCCHFRKVRPLEQKLTEFDCWATGLRRAQGESRSAVPKAKQLDAGLRLAPLADWAAEEVLAYAEKHGVPVHPLYQQGYTSIGCHPCTRSTGPGEDERAGRWWWEHGSPKECGLHFSPEGKVERTVDVLIREILAD
jgi:phosphoadenylyl-sulfate reductase (thioredoxin)